ncbi:MAG: hypothetical protein HQK49_10690 [Oligoflexia bacterium]|nr:hypothetical protein [Oligoflexia bacterium]
MKINFLFILLTLLLISSLFAVNVYSNSDSNSNSNSNSNSSNKVRVQCNTQDVLAKKKKSEKSGGFFNSALSMFNNFFSAPNSNNAPTKKIKLTQNPSSIDDVLVDMNKKIKKINRMDSNPDSSKTNLINTINNELTSIPEPYTDIDGIVKERNIPIYAQTIVDFPREHFSITDPSGNIIFSYPTKAIKSNSQDPVPAPLLIYASLNTIRNLILANINKSTSTTSTSTTSMSDENKNQLINKINTSVMNAFASRTQTFDADLVFMVMDEINAKNKWKVSTHVKKKEVEYKIVGDKIIASTKIIFSLNHTGDAGFDFLPLKGQVEIERQMVFSALDGTFSPEVFTMTKSL